MSHLSVCSQCWAQQLAGCEVSAPWSWCHPAQSWPSRHAQGTGRWWWQSPWCGGCTYRRVVLRLWPLLKWYSSWHLLHWNSYYCITFDINLLISIFSFWIMKLDVYTKILNKAKLYWLFLWFLGNCDPIWDTTHHKYIPKTCLYLTYTGVYEKVYKKSHCLGEMWIFASLKQMDNSFKTVVWGLRLDVLPHVMGQHKGFKLPHLSTSFPSLDTLKPMAAVSPCKCYFI